MEISNPNNTSNNLHADLRALINVDLLNKKTITYLSQLDLEAEQLWILRFYHQYGILPTIKQSRQIQEAYSKKKLTLKHFYAIMKTRLEPQKVIFAYNDFTPFFEDGITPIEIKKRVLNILSNWQNKHAIK